MNKQNINEADKLKKYLKAERIEKAPEGFTYRLMKNIQAEPLPSRRQGILKPPVIIPVISFSLIVLFLISAFTSSSERTNSPIQKISDYLGSLKMPLPEGIFSQPGSINMHMPDIITYLIAAIFMLALFDRALSLFFRREK